ncbi:MAG: DUF4328 domain-containing protein [Blastocatellia bacterium]|nr:DUF4328 domain-containing protein [Chloracidobacterium sp.]MBL8184781.1 DUF4328 domain-containing protein [Blastocatellia bacterium]HRJ88637.1 DUF4328 domain-containing protein [Pyrinomonadaceae bacterium]HRK48978.1 DUF4328 domain-containing protein [Pyrinomonadaceae bacterium]
MVEGYRSARNLSYFAIGGLALIAVTDLISVGLSVGQMVNPAMSVNLDEPVDLSLWMMLQSFVILLRFPFYVATVVLFLVWMYRAHKNLEFLRPTDLRFTPGWAVGWWFIPFANLVKPFQAMREIWCESDPEVADEPAFLSASLHSAPAFMGFWWAFWITSNIASNVTGNLFDPENMDRVQLTGMMFLATGILSMVAAALAIMVVRDTTNRQEQRFAKIGASTVSAPPPPPTFGGIT